MAIPRSEKTEKLLRKKKKNPPKQFRLSYSLLLLISMVIVGSVAGMVAYSFGKQALEGVNPSPAGAKLPKPSPLPKPKESDKASPQSKSDGKTSLFLDEMQLIAEIQERSQQELGGLTRPAFAAKADVGDRKKVYTRLERRYNSMLDPLAVSAEVDERIAARIALIKQRVQSRSRSYGNNFDRFTANNADNRRF